MGTSRRLLAGRQPYDAMTGLRIGAVTGALLGAIVALVMGAALAMSIPVLGAVGGVTGWRFERHQIEHERTQRGAGPRDASPG